MGDGNGTLTIEEFEAAIQKPDVMNRLKLIELPMSDAMELFYILDHDGSGELSVDEFIGGCMRLKGSAKSKDLLAVQISCQTLSKKMNLLVEKLDIAAEKTALLDSKTQRMTDM